MNDYLQSLDLADIYEPAEEELNLSKMLYVALINNQTNFFILAEYLILE